MRLRRALAVLLVLPACTQGASREEVSIFAAASLTAVFSDVGGEDPALSFNFLSSSDLATQIENGAPAAVFASADDLSMERVVAAGLTTDRPVVFATNKMAIIVPPDNPGEVSGLEDLADNDLVISLCNESCPAGRYARQVFDRAGIEVAPDSLESDVQAVVSRISLGEADAGIVYRSDVVSAGDSVRAMEIPDSVNVEARFTIAPLADASTVARDFIDLVLSPRGEAALTRYGFGVP